MANRRITDLLKQQKNTKKEKTKGDASALGKGETSTSADDAIITQREKDLDRLRQFDLNWEFGPCTGITRLERWERADKYGLNPPVEVKNLLLSHDSDKEYKENVWVDYEI